MGESSLKKVLRFKSPARVVIKFLIRSRDRKTLKCRTLKKEFEQAKREQRRLRQKYEAQELENRELKAQVRRAECERYHEHRDAIPALPEDPSIGRHGFGPRMITLAIRLAGAVGLRAASRVLQICFEWLGLEQKVPHFTTIRCWMQRWGIACLQKPVEAAEDMIWMADHSNQIGQEKVLSVLALRASELPPTGTTLKHADLHVLAVEPGISWKREDVSAVYQRLAKQYGVPRVILSDGAVELRDSVASLKAERPDCLSLQDFKHKAANFLESLVGKSQRFKDFMACVGSTRAEIQQTVLAHLTPPPLKAKARFMNLRSLLEWSVMTTWLLQHPEAKSRQWAPADKLESKLGWLRSFEQDLVAWDECQLVINRGLKFINTQGLFRGAAAQLQQVLAENLQQSLSLQLVDRLVEFVSEAESQIREGERLPLSTEILESSFALYKQLERQHSKGGFTSLLAAYAGLLSTPTPDSIKTAFSKVSTKQVKQWVREHLDTSLTAKRVSTYHEMKKATGRGRKQNAESVTKSTTAS